MSYIKDMRAIIGNRPLEEPIREIGGIQEATLNLMKHLWTRQNVSLVRRRFARKHS